MDREYLIKKWLNNELSEAEMKDFKALDDAAFYEEILQEAQRFKGEKHVKVSPFSSVEATLNNKKKSSLNRMKIISGIAAVFLIGIVFYMLWDKDKISTFRTADAQNETIILPDNSTVQLNQLSQLVYNSSNWNEERKLELKGEAFFDVEKGNRFHVDTEFGRVSVLGTEFNVFSRDSIFKVSCYEGLVQVTYENEKVELPAGSAFILKSGKALTLDIVVAEPYWIKNMSVFENVSIQNVILELEKQYKISVSYASDSNLAFTGAFEHTNLSNALKSITKPLNLTYIIKNEKEVILRDVQN